MTTTEHVRLLIPAGANVLGIRRRMAVPAVPYWSTCVVAALVPSTVLVLR